MSFSTPLVPGQSMAVQNKAFIYYPWHELLNWLKRNPLIEMPLFRILSNITKTWHFLFHSNTNMHCNVSDSGNVKEIAMFGPVLAAHVHVHSTISDFWSNMHRNKLEQIDKVMVVWANVFRTASKWATWSSQDKLTQHTHNRPGFVYAAAYRRTSPNHAHIAGIVKTRIYYTEFPYNTN